MQLLGLRVNAGLSRDDLAAKLGIGRETIRLAETGFVPTPRIQFLIAPRTCRTVPPGGQRPGSTPRRRSGSAPRGTAYIIDLDKVFEPPPAPVWSEPVLRDDKLTFRMEMAQPFTLRTRVEEDPFWRRPKDAGWRWVLAVIGYDWRKLRGRLRQIPRSIGVITGLSA